MIFVDTSAILAVINEVDREHDRADEIWAALVGTRSRMRTHSYVLVEATALVQSRHGMEALRVLHGKLQPVLSVRYVDAALHNKAVTALIAANRRSVSLVDWTSFELMREEQISEAFAFDDDFVEQGFALRR